MKYNLTNHQTANSKNMSLVKTWQQLQPLLAEEQPRMLIALVAILVNSSLNLVAPFMIGRTVDTFIVTKQFHGVLISAGELLIIYLIAFAANYVQIKVMGTVGQRVLFKLRNVIFEKLQSLPVTFFYQNKAGDLISRINNDTDKLNQFFSETLMRLTGNVFIMIGAGGFMLALHPQLGAASLLPAVVLLVFTKLITSWVQRQNAMSLQTTGGLSAEIQESLANFKVIVAFNRRDYFREKFRQVNQTNFLSAVKAGLANGIFNPVYDLAASLAQLIVLSYGIMLILQGNFTVGLLISFITYLVRFYDPLKQIASLWASFQIALAGWERISDILNLESDLVTVPKISLSATSDSSPKNPALLEFQQVSFGYPDGQEILTNISLVLRPGKTYALVGPTGGGKTTTASLMARLFDPTEGKIILDGQDLRSWTAAERTQKIGFILQEPFLFTGTVRENILYGNQKYGQLSTAELEKVLKQTQLEEILHRFDHGLDTKVAANGETMSLGQKQLIAFIRAVLREPELLILDEATANIDTVTEQLLEEIVQRLPKSTTKVIIAHRLNTIENADEIYFVNSGHIILAGSFDHAVKLLMHDKRTR